MKNYIYSVLCMVLIAFAVSSCERKPKEFSPDLLIGKWKRPSVAKDGKNGYECYRFDGGGNGVTWDTADDVSEGEAQAFTWSLDKDQLLLVHIGEMGQKIPKRYTIKELNSTTFSFEDGYGTNYNFIKFTGKP